MAIPTATTAVEAAKERLAPALESLEQAARQGRRAMVRSQHAVEDAAAAAALGIRRRPLSSVVLAAGIGALTAGLIALAFGWARRHRTDG